MDFARASHSLFARIRGKRGPLVIQPSAGGAREQKLDDAIKSRAIYV